MTLFKKKTQKPALLFCLKQQLEIMLIEKDHITDGNVYYKFYGI